MALPTLEKTWEVSLNNQMGGSNSDADHRTALLHIYDTLLGFTNNPWTLAGSCDGVTSGYPGPGWQDTSDIVASYSSAPRSWVVLQRPNSAGQLMIWLDTDSSASYEFNCCRWEFSPSGGYSGGGTTTKPAATDEQILNTGASAVTWYTGQTSAGRGLAIHYRHSTDGKHTYVFLCSIGICNNAILITTPEDAPSGWALPHLAAMSNDTGVDSENATFGTYYSQQVFKGVASAGGTAMAASMILPAYDGSVMTSELKYPSDLETSGAYYMTPIYLGATTGGAQGLLGRLPDIWTGSTERKSGDTYPGDGTKTFAQIGNFVVPWNGTLPLMW